MSVFKPIRVTESQLSSLPVIDGQLIFVTDTNKIYLDNNENRNEYNNNASFYNYIPYNNIHYSGSQEKWQEWINESLKHPVYIYVGDQSSNDGYKQLYVLDNITTTIELDSIIPAYDSILSSYGENSTGRSIWLYGKKLTITISNNKVTNVVLSSAESRNKPKYGINYLDTKQENGKYTPTNNYHPATKKYVDDSIKTAIGDALGGSY